MRTKRVVGAGGPPRLKHIVKVRDRGRLARRGGGQERAHKRAEDGGGRLRLANEDPVCGRLLKYSRVELVIEETKE